jgi:hypothetical protein
MTFRCCAVVGLRGERGVAIVLHNHVAPAGCTLTALEALCILRCTEHGPGQRTAVFVAGDTPRAPGGLGYDTDL